MIPNYSRNLSYLSSILKPNDFFSLSSPSQVLLVGYCVHDVVSSSNGQVSVARRFM